MCIQHYHGIRDHRAFPSGEEIVACTVKYNTYPLDDYEVLADKLDQESYMVVAKLAAILKVSNAMDRSHKQKFKNVKASLRESS